ncbi:MAG: NAD(P)/FAD-dependent oxidoreductase [Bdellovibrionales bacterium]|nr:NAD(P)/FAD-dependent oxidoreductase [Bdellovibrionales bacterium]
MSYDAIILGAGGAGLMCAIHAGRRGKRVVLLDHASKLGGKILISGGGRCNFTNLGAGPANYVSRNPHFCKSALSRFTPTDFVAMVEAHGIPYHEKKLGQQFCDDSAKDIVALLKRECADAGAEIRLETKITGVSRDGSEGDFRVAIAGPGGKAETLSARSLVVATGGLSIPKIGATGFGYDLAKQFGLKLVPRAPALDGFTFGEADSAAFRSLSGVSVDCIAEVNGLRFRENILFTHSGMSGPAALQASLHWHPGDSVTFDWLPDFDVQAWFLGQKRQGVRSVVRNLLATKLPARFADLLCDQAFPDASPLPQVSEKALAAFCEKLHAWRLEPKGTVGYGKAEVTRGGVDTDALSSKTMECRTVPRLYFIGEVVDVTGWLGGYNFQWAWASGHAAGTALE